MIVRPVAPIDCPNFSAPDPSGVFDRHGSDRSVNDDGWVQASDFSGKAKAVFEEGMRIAIEVSSEKSETLYSQFLSRTLEDGSLSSEEFYALLHSLVHIQVDRDDYGRVFAVAREFEVSENFREIAAILFHICEHPEVANWFPDECRKVHNPGDS